MLDFFVRLAQLAVHAVAFREKYIASADSQREHTSPEPCPNIQVQDHALCGSNRRDGENSQKRSSFGVRREGHESCGEDEEACGSAVVGEE